MADNETLAKVLFFDVVRQFKLSAGLSSVDAVNCYDSVARAIAALTFRAFGVPKEAVQVMLKTIEEMKYCLRTAYSDSKRFRGSNIRIKFQGLCQGNGAAPAGWAVVSIVILGAHKRKGHGAKCVCPVSLAKGELSAILFVDDTDVIHFDMEKIETALEAYAKLQESVESLGNLLMASGGALKPVKCFYYLISFEWNAQGQWRYTGNDKHNEFRLCFPTVDGGVAPIEHLGVDGAKETLGVFVCPSGAADKQLDVINSKVQEWTSRAEDSKVRRRDVWFPVDHQLWPRLFYGLCSVETPWDTLNKALVKRWYKVLPLGGV